MTVGVFEALAFIVIWVVTMICLTVSYVRDILRRRRRNFGRSMRALARTVHAARSYRFRS